MGSVALSPYQADELADFAVTLLVALPAYCGGALLLHDRLVRRGWGIERIILWMRGLILLYWLMPLSLLAAIGRLASTAA